MKFGFVAMTLHTNFIDHLLGPLPHTVVIAPGGKIIYRKNGAINPQRSA